MIRRLTEEEGVLEVIKAHRQGIKLVHLGHELGVDWRRLVGSVKALAEED